MTTGAGNTCGSRGCNSRLVHAFSFGNSVIWDGIVTSVYIKVYNYNPVKFEVEVKNGADLASPCLSQNISPIKTPHTGILYKL